MKMMLGRKQKIKMKRKLESDEKQDAEREQG
jgi:hypothetical protein